MVDADKYLFMLLDRSLIKGKIIKTASSER